MKRIFVFVTVFAMILSFAGCAGSSVTSSETASVSVSDETVASSEVSISDASTEVSEPAVESENEYEETPLLVFKDPGYAVYVMKGSEKVGEYQNLPENLGDARFV